MTFEERIKLTTLYDQDETPERTEEEPEEQPEEFPDEGAGPEDPDQVDEPENQAAAKAIRDDTIKKLPY